MSINLPPNKTLDRMPLLVIGQLTTEVIRQRSF